jgi:hypothetical protein
MAADMNVAGNRGELGSQTGLNLVASGAEGRTVVRRRFLHFALATFGLAS